MADNNQQFDPKKPGLSWSQPGTGNTPSSNNQPKPSQNKPNMPEQNTADSSGRVIGIIVGVVVIFALAAWGIAALHNRSAGNASATATSTDTESSTTDMTMTASDTGAMGETSTAPATPTAATTNTAASGTATFSVPTPQDAGTSVAFSGLSVSQPTWIIVYESTGGVPGNILGAGLFFPSDTSGSVPLLRATSSGKTYLVTAATDNGDMLFSIKDEHPVMDASGKQLWITLQTQ